MNLKKLSLSALAASLAVGLSLQVQRGQILE
jgi:hypothetical protein